jgi:hypothetical protein
MKPYLPEDRKAMGPSRFFLSSTALSFAVFLLAGPALAAKPASDCQQLQELYLDCHRLGQKSDSAQTCEEAARELLLPRWDQRTEAHNGKRSQASHALAELVCTTGCDDAIAGQPPATPQEFAEAFCSPLSATKPQGARP